MNDVYGMSIELATVLSVMGTVWTGDPLSLSPGFSLDKNSDKVVNLLGKGRKDEIKEHARRHFSTVNNRDTRSIDITRFAVRPTTRI